MPRKNQKAGRIEDALLQLDDFFNQEGLTDFVVRGTKAKVVLSAQTEQGGTVRIDAQKGNVDGFQERHMTLCPELPPAVRAEQAKVLASRGLTQVDIALSLGVSQKTISNDLRSRTRAISMRRQAVN
jgi:DNA-binding NarL/FixJ family response regulator